MATFTPITKREPAGPARTAVVASADLSFRQRVKDTLIGLHWKVREAAGGAEAIAHLDSTPAEVVQAVFADIDAFRDEKPLSDDQTLIAIRVK